MGRTLCDTTLGVIEIMNHEIRTTTVPNYNLRSKVAKVRLGESLGENEMYSRDKWNNVLEVCRSLTCCSVHITDRIRYMM